MTFTITTRGIQEVIARLANVAEAAQMAGAHRATVGSDLPYAKFVTDGTRAHTIQPKNGHALFWPGAAHPVKLIHHPGTRANPFMDEAAQQAAPMWALIVSTAFGVIGGGMPATEMEAALAKADAVVLKAAQDDAPVRTGDLRRSLKLVVDV